MDYLTAEPNSDEEKLIKLIDSMALAEHPAVVWSPDRPDDNWEFSISKIMYINSVRCEIYISCVPSLNLLIYSMMPNDIVDPSLILSTIIKCVRVIRDSETETFII
jgi:hypothetical protein